MTLDHVRSVYLLCTSARDATVAPYVVIARAVGGRDAV